MMFDWEELCDEETDYQVVLSVTLRQLNEVGERVRWDYGNAMLNGKPIGVVSTNVDDGTSKCPPSYCEGHHTLKEYLEDFLELAKETLEWN